MDDEAAVIARIMQAKQNNIRRNEMLQTIRWAGVTHRIKITHLNQLLNDHKCDSERNFVKAMKQHNIDQNTYYDRTIAGNHCMCMDVNGSKRKEAMTATKIQK